MTMRTTPTLAQRLLASTGPDNVFGPAPSAITPPAPVWLGQHTNPPRNEQRATCRHLGRRQNRKLNKYLNATQRS